MPNANQTPSAVLGGISPEQFLAEYWQKKPLLIRKALPDYELPLSPDELGGLACEDGVESRLVIENPQSNGSSHWQVENGPIPEERFATLPETHWTLLIQDVDKLYPPVAELLEPFRFIPDWRIDDVMISYAEPGGSVGPHVDQYDVFLVQTHGSRHWHWAKPSPNEQWLPNCDLQVLANFEAEQDAVLAAGDILYLPPGWAHHGVAVEPCVTCSVGFRAPSVAELVSDFCDQVLQELPETLRYADPELAAQTGEPGKLSPKALSQAALLVREQLDKRLEDEDWLASWFGGQQTSPKAWLKPAAADESEVASWKKQPAAIDKHPSSRWLYTETPNAKLCVDGQCWPLLKGQQKLARYLSNERHYDASEIRKLLRSDDCKALLEVLFRQGSVVRKEA